MFNPQRIFISLPLLASLFFPMVVFSATDPTRPPMVDNTILKPVVEKTEKVNVPATKVKKRKGWRLRSTLVSTERRTAVINNKVLMIGDKISGATLVDIQVGKVQIRVKGKIRTLNLIKKDVKINVREISHKVTRTNGL